MDFYKLLGELGIFGIIIAALVYVVRSAFDTYIGKNIEVFKKNLEKTAIEHQIRYAKLHEERAQVIKEVYKRIAIAEKCMKEYVTPLDLGGLASIEERRKTAADSANDYMNYYKENMIFLNDETCHLLNEINKCIFDAWHKFNMKDRTRGDIDYWDKSWKAITEKLPEARTKLEKVFRQIIGVES